MAAPPGWRPGQLKLERQRRRTYAEPVSPLGPAITQVILGVPVEGPDAPWSCADQRRAELIQAARIWAERTCREQGLAVKVSDPLAISRVLAVLRASDPPDRLQTSRIEAVETGYRRSHDHVVEDRGNDGSPLMEVQRRPLAS